MQDAGCRVLHHSGSGRCHACLPLMCLSIMPAGPACPNACPECLRVPSHAHLIISALMTAQVSTPPSLSSPIASSGLSELSPQILAVIYFCPHLLPSPSTFCLTSSSPRPRLIQLLLRRAVPSCSAASSLHLLAAAPSSFPSMPTPLPCACSYYSASFLRFRAAFIASLSRSHSSSAPTVPHICPRAVSVHE